MKKLFPTAGTRAAATPGRRTILAAALLAALSAQAATPIVISQVYGGGGNSGARYKNDFIELFNRGDSAVDISGWSVQYASATGSSWQLTKLAGNTVLQPGQYFLVQESAGTGGTDDLPAPDTTGTLALSGTAGKVALVSNVGALAGAAPAAGTYVDLVGFGTAGYFEGSAAAPTLSNTTAALRAAAGCTDADNNATDFSAGAPALKSVAL
ncbi:endonuclease/exonuclease/phosphatase, partial [Rugamonas sp. FT107W]